MDVATLLETRHPWASGLPFTRTGVCVTYLGPHLVLLIGEGCDLAGFDAYLAEVERALIGSPVSWRGGAVIHIGENSAWRQIALSDKRAIFKRWDELLARNSEKLRTTLQFSATICVNPFARAVVRTVNALRPSVVPTGISANAEDAWIALSRVFREIDVTMYLEAHARLTEMHIPSLRSSTERRRRSVT